MINRYDFNAYDTAIALIPMPEIPDCFQQLDTQTLRDGRKTWTPELFLDTEQDEYAVASMLLDMEEYMNGGPAPYPLEEALEDAYFTLLLKQAAEKPFQEFTGGLAEPPDFRAGAGGGAAQRVRNS